MRTVKQIETDLVRLGMAMEYLRQGQADDLFAGVSGWRAFYRLRRELGYAIAEQEHIEF